LWSFNKEEFINYQPKNRKNIVQYDLNYNIIASYDSLTDASKKTNININSICSCCQEKTNFAGGFVWKYDIA
jgi:hypothetical protein